MNSKKFLIIFLLIFTLSFALCCPSMAATKANLKVMPLFSGSTKNDTTLKKVSKVTTKLYGNSVNIRWNNIDNADGYEIYFSVPERGYVGTFSTTKNIYTVKALFQSKGDYSVKVRAYQMVDNSKIYGDYSDVVTFKYNTSDTSSSVADVDLDKVTELKADTSMDTVLLTWNKVSKASSYDIVLGIPGKGDVSLSSVSNSKKITGLESSNVVSGIYTVKIRAEKIINGSTIYGDYSDTIDFEYKKLSNIIKSSETTTKPDKVTNLVTSVKGDRVDMNWDKVANADGYEVYFGVPGVPNSTFTTTDTSLYKTGLTAALGTYTIKVRAYQTINGSKVYGDYSDASTFEYNYKRPDKVTNLTTKVEGDGVTMNWNKVDNVTGYEVYFGVPGVPNSTFTTTDTSLYKTGLSAALGTYTIKVRAYINVNGANIYGDYSDVATFDYQSIKLDKVTNVTTDIKGEEVTMSWNKVSNADGYEMDFAAPQCPSATFTTTNTSLSKTGLADATGTYTIKVRAYKTINGSKIYGEYSDSVHFNYMHKRPAKVTGVTNQVNGDSVDISWNSAYDVDGYEIYFGVPGVPNCTFTTSDTSISKSGLSAAPGTYSIKVRAFIIVNGYKVYGRYSDMAYFDYKKETIKIDKVTNLTAKIVGTKACLNWDKVSGADGYELFVHFPNYADKTLDCPYNSAEITGMDSNDFAGSCTAKVRAYKTVDGSKVYGNYSDIASFEYKKTVTTQPSKPKTVSNLGVSVVNTKAYLVWSTVPDVDAYELLLYTPKLGNVSLIYFGNSATLDISEKAFAGICTAKVRAYKTSSDGTKIYGDYSNMVTFEYKQASSSPSTTSKPAKVTNLKMTKSNGITYFTWGKVSGADGYQLDLNIPSEGILSIELTSTSASYYDLGIKNFTGKLDCILKVRAYKIVNGSKVYGDYSNTLKFVYEKTSESDTTKPDKVTGLTTTVSGDGVTMKWNKVSNATGYEVYFGVPGVPNCTFTTSNTSLYKSGLSAAPGTYTIKVRAYKTVNGSKIYGDYSNIASFEYKNITKISKPAQVTGLTTSVSGDGVTMNWNKVSNVTGYEVYFGVPGVPNCTFTTSNTSLYKSGLSAARGTYTIKVRAYNIVNGSKVYGDYSNTSTFTY